MILIHKLIDLFTKFYSHRIIFAIIEQKYQKIKIKEILWYFHEVSIKK